MTIDSNVAMNPGSRNSAGTTRRAFRGRWAVALLLSLISLTLGKSAGAEDYLYNPPVRLLRSGSWISVVRNPRTGQVMWGATEGEMVAGDMVLFPRNRSHALIASKMSGVPAAEIATRGPLSAVPNLAGHAGGARVLLNGELELHPPSSFMSRSINGGMMQSTEFFDFAQDLATETGTRVHLPLRDFGGGTLVVEPKPRVPLKFNVELGLDRLKTATSRSGQEVSLAAINRGAGNSLVTSEIRAAAQRGAMSTVARYAGESLLRVAASKSAGAIGEVLLNPTQLGWGDDDPSGRNAAAAQARKWLARQSLAVGNLTNQMDLASGQMKYALTDLEVSSIRNEIERTVSRVMGQINYIYDQVAWYFALTQLPLPNTNRPIGLVPGFFPSPLTGTTTWDLIPTKIR